MKREMNAQTENGSEDEIFFKAPNNFVKDLLKSLFHRRGRRHKQIKTIGELDFGANHLRYFGLRILEKSLDFYKNCKSQNTGFLLKFLSKYWISTKNFVEVQYFDKKFHRSPVFWDLEFL